MRINSHNGYLFKIIIRFSICEDRHLGRRRRLLGMYNHLDHCATHSTTCNSSVRQSEVLFLFKFQPEHSIMATIGSVTRQIAALELSNNKPGKTTTNARPPFHSKQSSQTNVAKLLTKYAAPNPAHAPELSTKLTKGTTRTAIPPPATKTKTTGTITHTGNTPAATVSMSFDIGNYDGGLELENEKRGEKIFGEAAQELALDSSSAQ